jgi:hypothetical protein
VGLESLRRGDKLQMADGSTVEVTASATEQATSIEVRVLDAPFGHDATGTVMHVDTDDIYGVYADDSLSSVRAL